MIDYNAAHEFSSSNHDQLKVDQKCGCFYCCKIFNSKEVHRFLMDGTAICPYCQIDSVIGENSGYAITEEFLREMHSHWF